MSSAAEPLLLDTHYWIWLQDGRTERFAPGVHRLIADAALEGRLLLSVISVWEVGMLESKGRIELTTSCEQWVEAALATPGLTLAPLTPEIALESTHLPGSLHGDPADRIIVATARRLHARLATRDKQLRDYARRRHMPIC